jgi:hypothetical protein
LRAFLDIGAKAHGIAATVAGREVRPAPLLTLILKEPGQRGVLFECAANVRTRFNLAEEMKQRPEGMKASGKELKAQPIRCFPALAERGIHSVEPTPKEFSKSWQNIGSECMCAPRS